MSWGLAKPKPRIWRHPLHGWACAVVMPRETPSPTVWQYSFHPRRFGEPIGYGPTPGMAYIAWKGVT